MGYTTGGYIRYVPETLIQNLAPKIRTHSGVEKKLIRDLLLMIHCQFIAEPIGSLWWVSLTTYVGIKKQDRCQKKCVFPMNKQQVYST